MEYLSCHYVNHCLSFNDTRIVYCTLGNQSKGKQYAVLKENYNGEPIDWDALLDRIEADKASNRRGELIESCKHCMMLRKRDWDAECPPRKFKYVLFSNWYACNSACRYCWKDGKNFLIKDVEKNSQINPNDTYDILPIVNDLIAKDLLTEDATIDFAGGEPTMYYKFNDALKMFIDAGIHKIIIHTNAIIYSEQTERAIREGIAEVLVSVDAGTKTVHQKVKRVVSYDRVMENLARYCQAKKPENANKVRSKFVIVPDFNDKESEILKWVKTAKNMGVSELVLNADDCMYMEKEPNLEHFRRVKELTDYFIKTVNELDCRYHLYSNAINAYTMLGYDIPVFCG